MMDDASYFLSIGQIGGMRIVVIDLVPEGTIIMSKNFYETLVRLTEGKVISAKDILENNAMATSVGRKDGE